MTLTDFLLARKTEQTESEIIGRAASDAVDMRLTPAESVEWMRRYDKTLLADSMRLNRAICNLGWAMRAALIPHDARREAAQWANHPDYRAEWAPRRRDT